MARKAIRSRAGSFPAARTRKTIETKRGPTVFIGARIPRDMAIQMELLAVMRNRSHSGEMIEAFKAHLEAAQISGEIFNPDNIT